MQFRRPPPGPVAAGHPPGPTSGRHRAPRCGLVATLLAAALAGPAMAPGCDGDASSPTPSGAILVVLPVQERADPDSTLTRRLADEATEYLAAQASTSPSVLFVEPTDRSGLEALAASVGAGLVVVLQADRVTPDLVAGDEVEALPVDSFRLETVEIGSHPNGLGSHGATVVLAAGHGALGDQYALYEVLRRLGARFYHPEEELVPAIPAAQLRARAATPTAVTRRDTEGRSLRDHVPDFGSRSYTLHFQHPLEHLEAFSDARHPIDEAVNANLWMLKNRADVFRGPGRGIAPPEAAAQRADELEAIRRELGMRTLTGITLHNEQQGSSAQIDPDSGVPVKQQIEAVVDEALAATPDAAGFGVHFGPTEFTVTPDQETVQWIDWAGLRAKAARPDVPVWINDHITGDQPTPSFDDRGCPPGTHADGKGDYYDLAFHADPSLGVSVHTVMFYPLEGPARVYDQRSFAHKLCLMQQASAEGRDLQWFPEGSWWLSFDNTVPVWLPIYIGARGRDVKLLQPLLAARGGGTLRSHRMFDSGHEWGYWQQDYAVGLWHWNTDVALDEVLAELTDGFCAPETWPDGCAAQAEAADVMFEIISHQSSFFLEREDVLGRAGGLYAYFAGEDPADEIGAATGFEFRPVRVAFRDVLAWDDELAQLFRVTDLAALTEAEGVYATGRGRMEVVRAEVPTIGSPFFEEVVDGLAVNELRARHTRQLYEAILAWRAGDEAGAAAARDAARATLAEVEVVIRRREAMYRYPLAQENGGGITPETAVANGTTYPYRVHTKTSLLTFWTYRQDQVDSILGGAALAATRLIATPVFADAGEPLRLAWPEADEIAIDVDVAGDAIDEPVASIDLGEEEGVFEVGGSIRVDGVDIPIAGAVARAARRAVSPAGGLAIVEPASDIAQDTVGSLAPAFHFALTEGALALAPEAQPDGDEEPLDFATVAWAGVATWGEGGAFVTEAVDFVLPLPNGAAGTTLPLHVEHAVFSGLADSQGFLAADGADAPVVRLEGGLVIDDVVDALIELAGFDRQGALGVLADVLGFDADDPPSEVPFVAELALATDG